MPLTREDKFNQTVVNCFQISIFAVHEQQAQKEIKVKISCELLSNYYLCSARTTSRSN